MHPHRYINIVSVTLPKPNNIWKECVEDETNLDHPVCSSCHKPFIARFHVNTANPTLVTTNYLTYTQTFHFVSI